MVTSRSTPLSPGGYIHPQSPVDAAGARTRGSRPGRPLSPELQPCLESGISKPPTSRNTVQLRRHRRLAIAKQVRAGGGSRVG
ncbi:hypothetical protein B0T14DRAFT_266832 [Immersiella caudata]|uniref:Uncharacterized protein n=1 Tax=Immersiella caudata TaxID=314043 RepID=A0AA40BXG3_9PEZI|nr:hypothetical protein B0T14DRAFT_266832 [Immersiella caudata]